MYDRETRLTDEVRTHLGIGNATCSTDGKNNNKDNINFLLYFTLLYFTLLYVTLLYFTLLYFTLLYFTLLYSTLLYFSIN